MCDTSEIAESNTKTKVALFLFFGACLQSRSDDDDGDGDCSSFTLFLNAVTVGYVVFTSFSSTHRRFTDPPASRPNDAAEAADSWNVDVIMRGSSMDLLWRILAALSLDCFKGSSSSRWGGHFIHLLFPGSLYIYKKQILHLRLW